MYDKIFRTDLSDIIRAFTVIAESAVRRSEHSKDAENYHTACVDAVAVINQMFGRHYGESENVPYVYYESAQDNLTFLIERARQNQMRGNCYRAYQQ